MNLSNFAKLVNDKCGLVISDGQYGTLTKAINARMSHIGIHSQNKYYESLLGDLDETHRLIDLLTINETYFFRENSHYDLLSNRLFPELLNRKKASREKIRILSAGCSSGEEPYSLAMTLMEKHGQEILDSIAIIACDINQEVLEKARRGIYGKHSFRGGSVSLRDKYFRHDGNQFAICDSIKRVVNFQRVNLLSDSYPAQLSNIDIIFYRNVSIYFKPDVQGQIFNKLSDILNHDGYIITSSTETLHHDIGILFLVELEGNFLYHKKIELGVDDRRKYKKLTPTPSSIKLAPPPLIPIKKNDKRLAHQQKQSSKAPKAKEEVRKQTPNQELFDKALYAAMDKKYAIALDFIDTLLKSCLSLIKAYNLKTTILINLERLEDARNTSLEALRLDEWNLECIILLGIIAKISGNHAEALKQFRMAIYIQPTCWLAHFYLAEIQNSKGVSNEASKEYGIAKKILETKGAEDKGVTYFPISYSVEQLIHLCTHNIAKLAI